MKKLLTVLLVLLCLAGCAKESVPEDEFHLHFDIGVEDVHLVVFSFEVEDGMMSVIESGYVDGSAITGDYTMIFNGEDFPEGHSPEGFRFHIAFGNDVTDSIMDDKEPEKSVSSEEIGPFDPEWGQAYYYKVTGSYEEGITVERIEK